MAEDMEKKRAELLEEWCCVLEAEGIRSGMAWAVMLVMHPEKAGACRKWENFGNREWHVLLRWQPQFADQYDQARQKQKKFSLLLHDSWRMLLGVHPELARYSVQTWTRKFLGKPPLVTDRCPWDKLTGEDWGLLLQMQPQFAEKCDWNKLSGEDWRLLLQKQPQFSDRFPWGIVAMSGWNWRDLLTEQPQFAEKCDWEKMDGFDWSVLLQKQPQFAEKCDWEKLDGSCWCGLLREQPQFAEKCDWNKLNGSAWSVLLQKQPQFAVNCDWQKLDGGRFGWDELLARQPRLANQLRFARKGLTLNINTFRYQPQLVAKFCRLSEHVRQIDDWLYEAAVEEMWRLEREWGWR